MKKYKGLISQLLFVICFAVFWQCYANYRGVMGFPPLSDIFSELFSCFTSDSRPILKYMGNSLLMIVKGLGIGAGLALVFSGLSVTSEIFNSIYNLIVSVFDLLPGVALLPILMITVGANDTSILILVIHSVIWPMSRSIIDGFRTTPKIYVEAGKNIGLKRLSLITGVYIPSSFANMLSGIKVGWARAWRGLISAEMIFGAAQSAGIGVFINNARTVWLDYAGVYAAIILIIMVGVIVEYGIFRTIEKVTVRKWGMIG
ncbi:MAG: ABC transporter permease [Acutalibacteraceae bacterium]